KLWRGAADDVLHEHLGKYRREDRLVPGVLGIEDMRMSKRPVRVLEKGKTEGGEEIQHEAIELGDGTLGQFSLQIPTDHLDRDRILVRDEIGTGAIERIKKNSGLSHTAPAVMREYLSRVIAEILQPVKVERNMTVDQSPSGGFILTQPFQT